MPTLQKPSCIRNGDVSALYEILLEEQGRYRARLSGSSRARKFYTLGLQLETASQLHPR
jgi:hypothetical protein